MIAFAWYFAALAVVWVTLTLIRFTKTEQECAPLLYFAAGLGAISALLFALAG